MTEPVLSARDVHVVFDGHGGPVPAVRGVGIDIHPGETLALVGESGSGKSAFAKAILRLHQPPFTKPRTRISGSIRLRQDDGSADLVGASPLAMQHVRARSVGMIFQEALSSLNPVIRIGDQVTEALRQADPALGRNEAMRKAVDILSRTGLPDPAVRARSYPHQLSGGQRQRVMIAIAAVRKPALLIADEPTTALDVTVQARILQLLKGIQVDNGMAMLFITHDLAVVQRIADRVAVMYAGQIVEIAPTKQLFEDPRHPYTKGLLASRPGHHCAEDRLTGQSPNPQDLPGGCAFEPRCPLASSDCARPPALIPLDAGCAARCVRAAP